MNDVVQLDLVSSAMFVLVSTLALVVVRYSRTLPRRPARARSLRALAPAHRRVGDRARDLEPPRGARRRVVRDRRRPPPAAHVLSNAPPGDHRRAQEVPAEPRSPTRASSSSIVLIGGRARLAAHRRRQRVRARRRRSCRRRCTSRPPARVRRAAQVGAAPVPRLDAAGHGGADAGVRAAPRRRRQHRRLRDDPARAADGARVRSRRASCSASACSRPIVAALVMTTRVAVKGVLAWSTIGQMGFMLVQCGLGAWHLALHAPARALALQGAHVPQLGLGRAAVARGAHRAHAPRCASGTCSLGDAPRVRAGRAVLRATDRARRLDHAVDRRSARSRSCSA